MKRAKVKEGTDFLLRLSRPLYSVPALCSASSHRTHCMIFNTKQFNKLSLTAKSNNYDYTNTMN
jgi:hypothetical protein